MNDDDQTADQADGPEQVPGQMLGKYLELIDVYVDARITDSMVEDRLRQFLLQRDSERVSGSPPSDAPDP